MARESPLLRRYGYKRCKWHKSFQKVLASQWSACSLQIHKRTGLCGSAKSVWLSQPAESLTSSLPWSLQMKKEISKIGDEIGIVWGGITHRLTYLTQGNHHKTPSLIRWLCGLGIKLRTMVPVLNRSRVRMGRQESKLTVKEMCEVWSISTSGWRKRRKETWARETGGIGGETISGSEVMSPLCSVLRSDGQRRKLGCVNLCVAGEEHIIVKFWGRGTKSQSSHPYRFGLGPQTKVTNGMYSNHCLYIRFLHTKQSILDTTPSCDFPSSCLLL